MAAHAWFSVFTGWFNRRIAWALGAGLLSALALSAQPIKPPADLEALHEQMLIAAAEGRIKAVETCLQSGANLHYFNRLGYTVLASALMHEQWDTADQLLKMGFTPGQLVRDKGINVQIGWSALSVAVLKHRGDWVQRLLVLGLDPDLHAGRDQLRDALAGPLLTAVRTGQADLVDMLMNGGAQASTASLLSNEVLMVAIEQKNLPVTQTLLRHGANPDQLGRDMVSPVAFACKGDWLDGVRVLIEAGADPYFGGTTSSRRGQNAFEVAATPATREFLIKACLDFSLRRGALDSGSAAVVSALYAKDSGGFARALQKAGRPSGSLLGLYPLLPLALILEDENAALALFKAGTEIPTYFQGRPYNPLTAAVDRGYMKLLAAFLEHGLDPRVVPGIEGWSPLGLASARGNLPAVQLLLAHGAEINPDPRYPKSSALMLAASNGHADVVQWLLAKGAGVDLVDAEGNTALMWGAWSGNVEVVHALLKAGSKIDHRNKNGDSGLAMAATENRLQATEVLLQAGARDEYLHQSLREKNIPGPVVDLVAKFHGKAIAAPTATEFFSLPRTAVELRTFISRGGDINYIGEFTPLQIVISRGEFQTASLLLNLGADPNALGKHELRSPLYLAVVHASVIRRDDKEALPIIKFLLDAGADPNSTNILLEPPLHLAIKGGIIATVNLLLEHGADPRLKTHDGKSAFDVLFNINLTLPEKLPIGRALEDAAKKLPPLPDPKPEPTKKATSF